MPLRSLRSGMEIVVHTPSEGKELQDIAFI